MATIKDLTDPMVRLSSGLYKLVDKDSETVGYAPNRSQRAILDIKQWLRAQGRPVRVLALKGRQLGTSTGESLANFDHVYWHTNKRAWMMAHRKETVASIFNKIKYAFDNLPPEWKRKPKFRSKNELYWPGTNSSIRVTTDPTGETIDLFHVMETALVKNANTVMPQYLAGVPKRKGVVVLEGTAYGVGGYFHSKWEHAYERRNMPDPGGFYPLFLPWTWADEYRSPVTPGGPYPEWSEEELDIARCYGLDAEQLQWRRETIEDDCNGDILLFNQFYPLTPEEAFISSGKKFFDQILLNRMLRKCVDPLQVKHYRGAELRIYAKRDPRATYVIGVDTSGGHGRDYSAAVILKKNDYSVTAVLHGLMAPNDLGRYLGKLGTWYNGAVVAVERNNHGHSVLNTLRNQVGYENVYRHLEYDRSTGLKVKRVGFPTTLKTRPIILDDLEELVDYGGFQIPDRAWVKEMIRFEVPDDGKPQAPQGENDDLVMAGAITVHVAKGVKRNAEYPHEITEKPEGF